MDLEKLQEQADKDLKINDTELDLESLKTPQLHNQYMKHLTKYKLMLSRAETEYNVMKKDKWEYYTGKLDEDDLAKYGWQPFPYTLKSEINTYLESDEDVNKYLARKMLHDEIVEVCQAILKELNNRTWELRSFIDWEKFIQGV